MLVLIKKSLVDAREELLISNTLLLNQRCVSGSEGLVMVHTQNSPEATCDSFGSFADPLSYTDMLEALFVVHSMNMVPCL